MGTCIGYRSVCPSSKDVTGCLSRVVVGGRDRHNKIARIPEPGFVGLDAIRLYHFGVPPAAMRVLISSCNQPSCGCEAIRDPQLPSMANKRNKKQGGGGAPLQTTNGSTPLLGAAAQRGQHHTASAHIENPANTSMQDSPLPTLSALVISSKPKRKFNVVKAWKEYWGEGTLDDWGRFCQDLGLEGNFNSKTKCKKACLPLLHSVSSALTAEH